MGATPSELEFILVVVLSVMLGFVVVLVSIVEFVETYVVFYCFST